MSHRLHSDYLAYDDMMDLLRSWEERYPDLVSVSEAGRSAEGRVIPAVSVTDQSQGADHFKPALYVDANQHAGELAGFLVVRALVERLVDGFGSEEDITHLLQKFCFYILPRVSPDGVEKYLHDPDFLRSSAREHPGTQREGIRPSDVDGNGIILTMRRPDPNGDWVESRQDSRLMVPRPPGQRQTGRTYYRLYPEGLIEGEPVQDPEPLPTPFGLDFNRNYPGTWRSERTQGGSGPFPLSAPETRAVADFVSGHQNIALAVTLHTWGGFMLRPPCTHPDSELPRADLEALLALGGAAEEAVGYRVMSINDDFASIASPPYGSLVDFFYHVRGILCFAPELWSLPARAGITKFSLKDSQRLLPQEAEQDGLRILQWLDENLQGEGLYPFEPFDHPQMGPVEIGGWDLKAVVQNPPPAIFESERDGMVDYLLVLAGSLPLIQPQEVQARRVSEDVYRFSVQVTNSGYLPTSGSDQAQKRDLAPEVRATVILPPGGQLLDGTRSQDLGHLEGSRPVTGLPVGPAASGRTSARATWLVRLANPESDRVEAEVVSVRGGRIGLTLKTGEGETP